MPQGSGYLTPAEVAERFRGTISVRTLANWRSMGIGPKFTKVGGRILYPVHEVVEWEAQRTVGGTAEYGRAAS